MADRSPHGRTVVGCRRAEIVAARDLRNTDPDGGTRAQSAALRALPVAVPRERVRVPALSRGSRRYAETDKMGSLYANTSSGQVGRNDLLGGRWSYREMEIAVALP